MKWIINKLSISSIMLVTLFLLMGCNGGLPSDPNDNLGGAAPVYQGMVLSDSVQNLSSFSQGSVKNLSLFTNLSTSYTKTEIKDIISNEMPYDNTSEIDHFADLNQDVFITVKLLNPDGQAILRFTLSGVVYQSFQFHAGSDSENLVLKVNSGALSGVKEFTIDEIKYVENGTNETKDAAFDGDRTIKLGVKYDNSPTALVNDIVHTATSMNVNANISDNSSLIEDAGNTLKAFLITNNEIFDSTDIVIGDNTLEFSKLSPDTEYVFVIATIIDILDGNGKQVYLLLDAQSFTTGTLTSIDNIVPAQESITFDITLTDSDEVGTITAIELYQGETLIEALTDLSLRTFSDLLSNNTYQIKVTYTYDLSDGVGEQELITTETVTTLAKTTPEVVVDNVVATQDSLTFDITVIDTDEVGSITAIELYQGETLVEALTDLSVRTFTNLLSNNEYQIKVTYTYDLNDGVGEQIEVITLDTITLASSISVQGVNILNSIIYTSTDILLRLQIENPDNIDLTYITINGTKYPTENLNNNQTILVNIGSLGEPGSFEMLFNEIEYTSDFGNITMALADVYIEEITVISELDILTIDTESGNEYLVLDGESYIKVELSNPSNFVIESITIYWDIKMNVIYETGTVGVSGNNGSLTWGIGEFIDYSSDGYILVPFTPTNSFTNDGLIRITIAAVQFYVPQYDTTVSASYLTSEIFSLVNNIELIEIFTAEDLQDIQSGYAYILMNDIDMTGYNWAPIHFSGYFDGNSHTISGISIIENIVSTGPHSYSGFFRSINGIVKDLTLQDIYMNVSANNYLIIGGLAGVIFEFSVVHDVEITGIISGNSSDSVFIGGVIGSYNINYEWDTMKYFYNITSSIVFLGDAANTYVTRDIVIGNGW